MAPNRQDHIVPALERGNEMISGRPHPAGLIGIGSATMGRYREFDVCLHLVTTPPGSGIVWKISVNLALNFNNMCRDVMADKNLQWLWILGDDHMFYPDTLIKLLARNVDIIAPLCLRRQSPFTPVIHDSVEKGHPRLGWDFINGKTGILEVPTIGNAGMLIRRNVIETMGENWHSVGAYNGEINATDINFCHKARKKGFKIYVDLDNPIGHINHFAVWPCRQRRTGDDKLQYSFQVYPALDKLPPGYA